MSGNGLLIDPAWPLAMGLLVARAVLPCFLLGYFFGGLDLLADLVRYVLLLLGSMLIAAVAASTRTTRERFGFVAGVLFFSWAARGMYSPLFIGPAATTSWLLVAMVMLVSLVLVLEYGAAELAPTAATHASRKRLSALVSRPSRRDLRGTWRLVAEAPVA